MGRFGSLAPRYARFTVATHATNERPGADAGDEGFCSTWASPWQSSQDGCAPRVGESEAGDQLDLVGLLLCAVASLPLIARRRAPVLVFVLTGLASVALRLAADPVGPPLGPTLALYWMVAAGESRAAGRG